MKNVFVQLSCIKKAESDKIRGRSGQGNYKKLCCLRDLFKLFLITSSDLILKKKFIPEKKVNEKKKAQILLRSWSSILSSRLVSSMPDKVCLSFVFLNRKKECLKKVWFARSFAYRLLSFLIPRPKGVMMIHFFSNRTTTMFFFFITRSRIGNRPKKFCDRKNWILSQDSV